MALKLKEFDYKQFLLEKGERVGLYAAGGIALLMIVLSLFLPDKGLLSPSPRTRADVITKTAQDKKNAVATASPDDRQTKELRDVDPQLQKQAGNVAQDPVTYRLVADMFAPREIPSNKRQNPSILVPEEFRAEVLCAQINNYMMKTQNGEMVVGVLEKGNRAKQKDPFKDFFKRGPGGGGPGTGGGPGGGPGMGGGPGGGYDPFGGNRGNRGSFGSGAGSGDKPGAFGSDDRKDLEVKWVRKDEVSKGQFSFARDLWPLQSAVVVGSFPLKAQIDQFQKALRIEKAYSVVFDEMVTDKDKNGTRPAFEFTGFNVMRKTYGPDGKPILGSNGAEWQPLDLETDNSAYVIAVAQVLEEFAAEDPKVLPLLVPGLYLPRPVQIPTKHGDGPPKSWPDVETELPKIKETLAALTPKQSTAVQQSKFDKGKYNVFGKNRESAADTNYKKPTVEEWAPPAYCVMRFLDLTLQPGLSYEYQVQVRMQNPNWNKPETEVANKQMAVPEELFSEWVPVKGPDGKMLRVSVPGDLNLYAVDEVAMLVAEKKNPKDYKGMAANDRPDPSRQTVVQIHRWMSHYELTRGTRTDQFPVGDWVVGERIFALRGEYVGSKKLATHVPIWAPEQSTFVLAGQAPRTGADKRPTADMTFIEPKKAPLLVDFEGGTAIYRRGGTPVARNEDGTPMEGAKPTPGTEVKVPAATEILLLSPDGKLLAHDSAADEKDKERTEREKEYSKRVDEASGKTDHPAPAAGGKPGAGGDGRP
jgi:hypothetical protein